ncbi:MAG: class I SAM-dependent methyltransferase [Acidimicrobiales bacterium]
MSEFDFEAAFGENYLHFYVPMLNDERNRAEVDEIVETLDLNAGDRVLDAPCGHGRISNLLASRGMVVTGVDQSALFLSKAEADAAAQGGPVPKYLRGDLRELPLDEGGELVNGGVCESTLAGAFDAVLCWFTSFGYFDDDGNRKVLSEFYRALRPGGMLLIETMHRDAFVRGFTPEPFAHVTPAGEDGKDLEIDVTTFDSEIGSLRTRRTVVRDGVVSSHVFTIRLPALTEFRQWLGEAGFSSVEFQSRHGEALTLETRRLVVLARA